MTSARRFILIFAHPRSGSTTLAQALNRHPEMNIIEEPFASRAIESVADLEESLDALMREPWLATGIKHVYNFSWPFPVGQAEQCNRHLLLHPGWVVVFLWRRNLFEATLSNLIARQMQVWDVSEGKQLLRERSALAPVPLPSFRACYRQLAREITVYRDCLAASNRPFIELTYEDLYGPEVRPEQQMARVTEILLAAGYSEIRDGPNAEAIRRLLATDNKVNCQTTYDLIPNFRVLKQALDELTIPTP